MIQAFCTDRIGPLAPVCRRYPSRPAGV